MTLPDTMNPSPEMVNDLRRQFQQKMEKSAAKIPPGGFHENDLNRIFANDVWLTKFLENNDLDMKESLKQLWETCIWRKTANINEICEDNIRMDYVHEGMMFPRGKDIDGKTLFIYRSRLYTRGSRNLDDMKRVFLYWLERLIREANDDYLTFMFELTDAGLSNVDMDYTRYIITTLKNYYPYSLNYILVYDLPWILNATFHIIKKLLPAKAVDRLKNINNKSIRDYVSEESLLVPWGGMDDYEFKFVPEKKNLQLPLENNNSIIHNNNNTLKKVHFANLSPTESPMNESSNSNFENVDGEMLRIIPQSTIAFTKSGNELHGNVEIINIDTKAVTYKIKTTAPEKFRVRPSTGVLSPGGSVTINVVLQQGQQVTTLGREKFLVMCMALGNDLSTNTHDLAELWKNTAANSASVEQHRLKCSLPTNLDDGSMRNGMPAYGGAGGDMYGSGAGYSGNGADKQFSHFQQAVSQLRDSNQRLESQVKFNQTLQWISLALFLLLSVAIVYILKIEIKNSTSQYCLRE
ncbi:motile sperm domain-containing protein 2-like [Malaya genurostris]|uniref:motile sperm domain-containing protein 2-like n=1 Tax=Malaya genurostris TaxID=325434 RepID=UPI0026F3B46F|nr:motile sperm domain-containing protein 2-like [Malaya genurostris]XP_058458228.1 motile sperm domain-containing protein 2-like [Malaya genurostris]XP_058458229.1 motile sperm domain-containing protein 2-like [Malaya genurostris]XP_058458230.1 motile sperm domain-containing protein 2-like [Malaya genurostris]XP_058458231.1 motile sperm domain-containing protein 2-like [Malaya genurostris]XP_058458232.1 motile sperm domain-containing protein 2-like [Malaya genurostris]